jgi:signal transduction histidine kinase
MIRLLPRSLFGQTVLILLAGLIVSHAVVSFMYTSDREQAVRAVGGLAAAQRIANLTRLVREAPREWRQRIVSGISDDTFQVSLSVRPAVAAADDEDLAAQTIREYLEDQVSSGPDRRPRVVVSPLPGPPFAGWRPGPGMAFGPGMAPGPGMALGPAMGRGRMMQMHGFGTLRSLQVAMPLPDGEWLSFATALPDTGPGYSRQFLVSMALMTIIIVVVSVWAARRVTAPLASLAAAAERLGRDMTAPPLEETGTLETRQASRAFNDMQTRLRSLVENRTRLLAALSHDLRTPLTLLRLRAENVEDAQERDKMLSTIAEMDAMIGTTLTFARDEAAMEARRPTDLAALVQSIVDDMADAGMPATMQPAEPIVHECRPDALKRAIRNLLDNAVKYGKTAQAAIRTTASGIEITVDDEGPGIPEVELSRVFEPFYRLEDSRSRETGGVGLGLAIAQSIVHAHGGELRLANRPTGGLSARVTLSR